MAKRKLSRQQLTRIRSQQAEKRDRARSVKLGDSGPESGVIISHFGQQLEIESLETGERQRCYARANLEALVTGDRVIWRSGQEGEGVVEAMEPRQSLLCRPDKFGKLKPVAANITRIAITIAPEPEAFSNLIDRYLVAAEVSKIPACLVLNKADLMAENERKAELIALMNRYEQLGYPCLRVSAASRSGLQELRQALREETVVFVGQSGVGKSSLIQALLPEEDIRVGELSEARAKGTHTTTAARLYHLPEGGKLVDSPGIREFGLWHINEESLLDGFVEFHGFLGDCRFRDCKHFIDPGCGLSKALKQGRIHPDRATSYQLIRDSLDEVTIR